MVVYYKVDYLPVGVGIWFQVNCGVHCTLYNFKLREGSFEALIEIPGADEDTGDYESNDHQNPGPDADTNNGLG